MGKSSNQMQKAPDKENDFTMGGKSLDERWKDWIWLITAHWPSLLPFPSLLGVGPGLSRVDRQKRLLCSAYKLALSGPELLLPFICF